MPIFIDQKLLHIRNLKKVAMQMKKNRFERGGRFVKFEAHNFIFRMRTNGGKIVSRYQILHCIQRDIQAILEHEIIIVQHSYGSTVCFHFTLSFLLSKLSNTSMYNVYNVTTKCGSQTFILLLTPSATKIVIVWMQQSICWSCDKTIFLQDASYEQKYSG